MPNNTSPMWVDSSRACTRASSIRADVDESVQEGAVRLLATLPLSSSVQLRFAGQMVRDYQEAASRLIGLAPSPPDRVDERRHEQP